MYADANLATDEDLLNSPTRWLQILARLRPGISAAQAQAGLLPWFRSWLEESTRRPGLAVVTAERRRLYLASTLIFTPAPQGHAPLRLSLSQPLWLLFAATGVLLGLACLNVAGLFVARGSARARELATRLALGASRGRIGRQLLADSLLLALTGGVLGIALAPAAMRALIAFLPHDLAANALRPSISLGSSDSRSSPVSSPASSAESPRLCTPAATTSSTRSASAEAQASGESACVKPL